MSRSDASFRLAVVLSVLGVVFWTASAVRADMVLCKSFTGYVKAREGSCKRWEAEIPIGQDTNAKTICPGGTLLDGDGNCVDDPNACAAGEVLLGGGVGCTPLTELVCDLIGHKTVFVSSSTHDGALGGLAGADAICNQLAAAEGLSGTYKAWLSDGTDTPNTRFARSSCPYELVDGTRVADDYADLTNCAGDCIQNAIRLDETGSDSGGNFVWTSTRPGGGLNGGGSFPAFTVNECGDWTSNSDSDGARGGNRTETGIGWTNDFFGPCDSESRLYCFQQ